jgi:hypothetical protein
MKRGLPHSLELNCFPRVPKLGDTGECTLRLAAACFVRHNPTCSCGILPARNPAGRQRYEGSGGPHSAGAISSFVPPNANEPGNQY